MGRTQDFTNSVIYHIRDIESKEIVYVGSTTNFPQRKSSHKHECNHEERKHFTYPIYCHIRDNGGFNCFEVIPIKLLKLLNKTELLIAEQEEIDRHRTLANRQKAHMTIEDRKEYHKKYDKQYQEEHKEDIKQYKKQYYQEHKEIIKEERKEYYQENKEIINEKRKQSIMCPICNSATLRRHLKRHQRTKKCQEHLNK
jgi:hypothetical protein